MNKKRIAHLILYSTGILLGLTLLSSFVLRMTVFSNADPELENASEGRQIQINVLNGCGEPGIASRTKIFMRLRKFDVVEIGNARKNHDKSMVIDRLGDIRSARKTAQALGIPDSMVVSEIDSNLYLNCSVILGKDFRLLRPFD